MSHYNVAIVNDGHQNVIGVKEIADLMHISRRQFQRMVRSNPKPPGLIPPYRAPGRGSWFERDVMLRWIAKNKRPDAQRNKLGRKQVARPPHPTAIWQRQAEAIPKVPYDLFRSRRRIGCAEFAASLSSLADSFANLPAVIGKVRGRVGLQSEYDAILRSIERIHIDSLKALNALRGSA